MTILRKDGQPDRRAGRNMPPVNRTHGHASGDRTPEYRSWRAMRARCLNPMDPAFKRYGGRGITVCERWHSFANFLEDMGPRPPGTSLERDRNNDGYAPDNCRWATAAEQQANRRCNHAITINGETATLAAWCAKFGLDPSAVRYRMRKFGWTVEQAIITPKSR